MGGYITKGELLGASDLREEDVDLPSLGPGAKARCRGLPAAYSNEAQSEALETTVGRRGEQTARVNTNTMECLQVLHGLVDPKLDTIEEVRAFASRCGPSFRAIVDKIDELSGVDKEAIEKANATFRDGGPGEAGADVEDAAAGGDRGPDLHLRVGAGAGDAR